MRGHKDLLEEAHDAHVMRGKDMTYRLINGRLGDAGGESDLCEVRG